MVNKIKPNNNKPQTKKEVKRTNSILKILLIGYIIVFILSLFIMYSVKDRNLNTLYDTINNDCYNNDSIMYNNSYVRNEVYIIYYDLPIEDKYYCSIVTKKEFDNKK